MAESVDPDTIQARWLDMINQMSETFRSSMDSIKEAQDEGRAAASALDREMAKLGKTINKHDNLYDDADSVLQERADLEKEVNDQLRKSVPGLKDATDEKVKEYKATQLANKTFEQLSANLNDQIASTVALTAQQYKQLEVKEQELKAAQRNIDNLKNGGENLAKTLGSMKDFGSVVDAVKAKMLENAKSNTDATAGIIAGFAILQAGIGIANIEFDTFISQIKASYAGMLEYNRALVTGADGYTLANKRLMVEMKAQQQQLGKNADSYLSLTKQLGMVAAGMVLLRSSAIAGAFGLQALTGPVGLVIAGLTALAALFGLYKAGQAKQEELALEQANQNLELQNEMRDKLYNTYMDIGKAGLNGSRGIEALTENAHKAGFAIKDIEKFTGVLKSNQKEMSLFAAGAAEGVDKFSKVAAGMNDTLGGHFRDLGISIEEQTEEAAKYMALQARLGLSQGKTQAELQAGAGKYLDELDKTATLLGTSRKEQEDARGAVMGIQQLRAAMMAAEDAGDKDEAERLERYLKQASELQAKGLTQEAAGLAKLGATKGAATDKDTIVARQTFSNDYLDKLNKGAATQTQLTIQAAKELRANYGRNAQGFAATGASSGQTGEKFGAAADLGRTVKLQEDEMKKQAAAKGIKEGTPEYTKFQEDFLEAQKKATDDETKKANELRLQQQKDAIDADKKLLAFSNKYAESVSKFDSAVNKFAGGDTKGAATATAGAILGEKTPLDVAKEGLAATEKEMAETTAKRDAAIAAEKKAVTAEEKAAAARGTKYWNEKLKELTDEKKSKDTLKNRQEELQKAQDKITAAEAKKAKSLETATFGQKMGFGMDADQKKAEEELLKARQELMAVANKPLTAFEKSASAAGGGRGSQGAAPTSGSTPTSGSPPSSAPAAGGAAAPSRGYQSGQSNAAPTSGGASGTKVKSSNDALKDAGLTIKKGDVQGKDKEIDPKLIDIAKQVQSNIPGFMQFTGFNDQFHNEKAPGSKHTSGEAFDFTLAKAPSKEEGSRIVDQLKSMGIDYAQDEYNNASSKATGGHIHGQLNELPKAYDGGVFDLPKAPAAPSNPVEGLFNGSKSGYPVELHGREAVVPLPDPASKIKIETPDKEPLSSVISNTMNTTSGTTDTTNNALNDMMAALIEMMEEKMDTMIDKLDVNNTYSDKLVKAMA
jgi:hypothetical protein